jgi:nucleoid-associated protein YgaU
MRNDLKIGIIVGVLVVIGVIIFLVSPGGDSASNAPENPAPPPPPPVTPIKTTTPAPPETKPVEIVVVPEEVPAPPEEIVKETVTPPVEPEPVVRPPRYHIVKEGDSLSSISEQYFGHGKYWTVIHQTNKNIIQNPDHLQLGWKLRIPYPDEVPNKP